MAHLITFLYIRLKKMKRVQEGYKYKNPGIWYQDFCNTISKTFAHCNC